jgi:hypothetical protein
MKQRKEEEECADNQQIAQNEGFCCHHHAKRLKPKDEEEKNARNQQKWTGRITAFTATKTRAFSYRLNDTIYYDSYEYENALVSAVQQR